MKIVERFVNEFFVLEFQWIYLDIVCNFEFSIKFEKYTHSFVFEHVDKIDIMSQNEKIVDDFDERIDDVKIVNNDIIEEHDFWQTRKI